MSKLLLGLIVIAIGAVVGWYVLAGGKPLSLPKAPKILTKTTPTPTTPNLLRISGALGLTPAQGTEKGGVAERSVVTFTDNGFSPSPLTVAVGTTVTFVNESSKGMWVASAVHPTHKVLPGFDQLKSTARGGMYEYTFTKVGTWNYHNHVAPQDTGSVIVTN